MERECTLVILAAGLGSRFGGIKQLKQVGPAGEIIMDYSIYDAIRAGFRKIVFIIRREIEADFRAVIGKRAEAFCAQQGVQVAYAYQDMHDLPGGYVCPAQRIRPWGTGHALLACRELLNEPFTVLNADDYYGQQAFDQVLQYLKQLPNGSTGRYCMAGFHLRNTLSDYGGVTRGICQIGPDGTLCRIEETRNVVKTPAGAAVQTESGLRQLDADTCVSMNMWGFTPDLLPALEERFCRFLAQRLDDPAAEFLLPDVVDQLLGDGLAQVRVLPTADQWFGMTFQEDMPLVVENFHRLVQQGVYKPGLY